MTFPINVFFFFFFFFFISGYTKYKHIMYIFISVKMFDVQRLRVQK